MSSLPKSLATLAAVMAFCASELLCLLRNCPPLSSMKRAAACALLLGTLCWVCAHVGLSVLRDGLRDDSGNGRAT